MLPGKDNRNFIAFAAANRALAERIKRKLALMAAKTPHKPKQVKL